MSVNGETYRCFTSYEFPILDSSYFEACEKLPEPTRKAFPLLERMTDAIANNFPAKSAVWCRNFHIQSHNFSEMITPDGPRKNARRCL